MREEASIDHLSVGMRRPTGEYERPISGARLFWTKPGTLVIITLNNNNSFYRRILQSLNAFTR